LAFNESLDTLQLTSDGQVGTLWCLSSKEHNVLKILGKSNITVHSHELPVYRNTVCPATHEECGEKGRRRCVPEQRVWAMPGSVMNTPSRTRSNDSCQKASPSFEVRGKGPAQDRRSEDRLE